MAGPMGLTGRQEEQGDATDFQMLAIQNVVASQGTTLFQFQQIPEATPQLERNDLEQQRAAAPNQLMGFVAAEDVESFVARGNQLGLVDPSATYVTVEQRYLVEANNIGRERGRTAVADGNTAERDSALDFLETVHRRLAAKETTPEAQETRLAQLTRDDLTYMGEACTTDQERIDLLNAAAREGFHAPTLIALQSEWNLNQQEQQQDSATMQIPLGMDGAFEQPLMFAIQEGMRRQLDDIRTMQQRQTDPAEIRRSEAYQRLASMVGARRAEQAVASVAGGQSTTDAATAATTNIYARHLLDTGNLNVVPVRRQQGG
jgi:hypothetical protein